MKTFTEWQKITPDGTLADYRRWTAQQREENPLLVLSDVTLSAIQAEATRAHIIHGIHSMLTPAMRNDRRLAILAEEVGEVARELNDAELGYRAPDRDKLVKELIQVAAMAATWVEALEGKAARAARHAEDRLMK